MFTAAKKVCPQDDSKGDLHTQKYVYLIHTWIQVKSLAEQDFLFGPIYAIQLTIHACFGLRTQVQGID